MAKDGMSFDKYIDNPSGQASVVTNRQMYKAMYKQKFNAVLVREQGQIKWTVYQTKDKNDSWYIHIKVPSEVIEKFYYDVVIRLFTSDNVKKTNANLREYAVQFYSNDPAFVYTFAYSFNKNRLFIDDLKPKMSSRALSNRAEQRNPKDNVWYVKSLYFAYLIMERDHLFQRSMLTQYAKKYNVKELLKNIEHADKKVKARQEEQEKLNRSKQHSKELKERADAGRHSHLATKVSKISPIAKTSKVSSAVKKTQTTRSVKTTIPKSSG